MDLFSVLKLILGLAFFLFGMNIMSSNLEKMAGGKLEQLLKTMTANPIVSLALGAAITIAVQSSSAVTVMLVGLVNSGIMKFGQTLYVIFGANIGTTLTAWILSLSGIQSDSIGLAMLKPENFSPILALIGVIMIMVCKNDRRKSIGTILVGFTVLMYGMVLMTGAVRPLADLPQFSEVLVSFKNPLLGVLVSALFTAVIQSSAASVGILQALSLTGGITFQMAIPVVMGLNIGTCATSMISSIGTSTNAKRVAVIHLSIKVIGTLICLPLYLGLAALLDLGFIEKAVTPVTVALIHTVYNIAITLILMPFTRLLVRLGRFLVPEETHQKQPEEEIAYAPDLLLLRSPSVALRECDQYTFRMAEVARETLHNTVALFSGFDENLADTIAQQEDTLDLYEDRLDTYLVYLSAQALSEQDSRRVGKMQRAICDMERLGDHALNLMKSTKDMQGKALSLNEEAGREVAVLTSAISEILDLTIDSYVNTDRETAYCVEPLEEVIDDLTDAIKRHHIRRLEGQHSSIEMGFILSDILTDFERVSDHCSNIALTVIELSNAGFDSHRLVSDMKHGSDDFKRLYQQYSAKYSLN